MAKSQIGSSGGFAMQCKTGKNKRNFEVVIPNPQGGLQHYWRDNDRPDKPWHTVNIKSSGLYASTSLLETSFRSYEKHDNFNNFGVLATKKDGGILEYFERENAVSFRWKSHIILPALIGKTIVSAVCQDAADFATSENGVDKDKGLELHVLVTGPKSENHGIEYWVSERRILDIGSSEWYLGKSTLSLVKTINTGAECTGICLAACSGAGNFKYSPWWGDNRKIFAATNSLWQLHVGELYGDLDADIFDLGFIIQEQTHKHRGFIGRPSIIESTYGYRALTEWNGFWWEHSRKGRHILAVSLRGGGILILYKDNAPNTWAEKQQAIPMDKLWTIQAQIGKEEYDELTLFQGDFGAARNGNLELIARRNEIAGFDHFWLDAESQHWSGPVEVRDERIDLEVPLRGPFDSIATLPNGKTYATFGGRYVCYSDANASNVDPGYHRPIAGNWGRLPQVFLEGFDSMATLPNGKTYITKGDQYVCYSDSGANIVDQGYPRSIGRNWGDLPQIFTTGFDSIATLPNGKTYITRGNQYVRYSDPGANIIDPGYPKLIAGNWGELPAEFNDGFDAMVTLPNGKTYIMRGNQYVRYSDFGANIIDQSYPKSIAGNWGLLICRL